MEPTFLYERWVKKKMFEYLTISCPPQLKGRIVTLSPKQYGGVLLQAYVGRVSIEEIASFISLKPEKLYQWRKEPEFMLASDWNKCLFASEFTESMVLKDYSMTEYHEIAGEFSILEESLRVSARIPLFHRFRMLGQRLLSKVRYGIEMDRYDMVVFKRLFAFFLALEYHWPSPASKRIKKDFMPLAEKVIWPELSPGTSVAAELEDIQGSEPIDMLLGKLAERLRQIFDYYPCEIIR